MSRTVTVARTRREARRITKRIAGRLRPRVEQQLVVMILGCQRSGTNMLLGVFDRDPRMWAFPERSVLSSEDVVEGLRLNGFQDVHRRFADTNLPGVVMKPLVESQRAKALLDEFSPARCVWMIRGHRAVARSHVVKGSPSVDDLRSIACDVDDWRSEYLEPDVIETVKRFYRPDMSPYDAAALYWYTRNSHLFRQGLDSDPTVAVIRYEELAGDPGIVLSGLYRWLGIDARPPRYGHIHARSVDRGEDVVIDPEIDEICATMGRRLDEAWNRWAGHNLDEPGGS